MTEDNIGSNITQVHGHIESIGKPKIYGDGKKLINFRLKTQESYPTILEFTLYEKGIQKLGDKIWEGNEVIIKFNLKGREYNDNIYHSLVPWSIEVMEGQESKKEAEDVSDPDLDEDVPF
jgi:hypothetical protein